MDPLLLHQESLVIDSHNDTLVAHIRRGGRSLSGEFAPHLEARGGTVDYLRGPLEPEIARYPPQIDFPSMRAGGIDAAFFAVDVTRAWKNHLAYALDAFGYLEADLAVCGADVCVARSAADILAARSAGRLAAVLVVENSDALEGSLNILRALYALGVRSIGLTHNPSTWAAAGNAEAASGGGLTRFGRALVREMNAVGMLVDVSHIAERGFYDTLDVTERPVIASHSCCAALCEHPRNLTDAQLRALAQNGGVVGITFVPMFVDAQAPTFERLLDHVDHAVAVAGIEHVGIGSDFDGGGTLLPGAADFPLLTAALLERGYRPEHVRRILGENHLRVLAAALGG